MIFKAALKLANQKIRFAHENEIIFELGYEADLGTDDEMAQGHTDLENEDLENVDTRADSQTSCSHRSGTPGNNCPGCGMKL